MALNDYGDVFIIIFFTIIKHYYKLKGYFRLFFYGT